MPLGEVAQSYLHPLRFPPQQHKIAPGVAVDPETQKGYEIPRVDDDAGLVWLKRGKRSVDKPLPRALIPPKPIPQTAQEAALRRLAEAIAAPRLRAERRVRPAAAAAAARCAARRSRSTSPRSGPSALFIQGPPGSGKTYTGARLICSLLRAGRRVGVAATSHKAIANLLEEVEEAADDFEFRGLKKSGGGNPESVLRERAHRVRGVQRRVPARPRGAS